MPAGQPKIQDLWKLKNFSPNKNQEAAILHTAGPLFLTAGPGSGKTRVLLWRTLNLIVYHGVKPEEIFLATFTGKAALQLKDGLRSLLALVTNQTGTPYDISRMAIGTVHSICLNNIISNRNITEGQRQRPPILMDDLSQYFFVYNRRFWRALVEAGGWGTGEEAEEEAQRALNLYLQNKNSSSRHEAVQQVVAAFNRFSEERIDPDEVQANDENLRALLDMYAHYLGALSEHEKIRTVDFALLQQAAYDTLLAHPASRSVYKHVIVDEYQDTNSIQEKIYFHLASGHKNICVVGDDDQALYRFRGATVENLVEFESRCKTYLGCGPTRLDLDINYRSRSEIVTAYTSFMDCMDWRRRGGRGHHRIADKNIKANSKDRRASVVLSQPGSPQEVCEEVADFVVRLKEEGKIEDYSQVAFLFPSVKTNKVDFYRAAFARHGVEIYAPRAGRFLEVPEAVAIWGLLMHIFGRPNTWGGSGGMQEFNNWIVACWRKGEELMVTDPMLKHYIADRKQEVQTTLADYEVLIARIQKNRWDMKTPVTEAILRDLATVTTLSAGAKKTLSNKFFLNAIANRKKMGKEPFALSYVVNRLTSPDWSVLDLFYQLNGFAYFAPAYKGAEDGSDEGPICNLGLISGYIARFLEEYGTVITGSWLRDDGFQRSFFNSYTYALFRRGESEYEDSDDPFPKGRIPFLTIHQSKGLEFPVVVLGNPYRQTKEANQIEYIMRDLLDKEGEPLDRISAFDNMRVFYVALSRAQNLLVIPRFQGRGQSTYEHIRTLVAQQAFTPIADCDTSTIPAAKYAKEELGAYYSYTGDYLGYLKCPRQYMIFRKYGFVPSRSQTMFFGSLVHQTIEDLHHLFIQERKKNTHPA